MHGMNSESVDLIYLYPPFNRNAKLYRKNYTAKNKVRAGRCAKGLDRGKHLRLDLRAEFDGSGTDGKRATVLSVEHQAALLIDAGYAAGGSGGAFGFYRPAAPC